tara:strand:+ start:11 stop:829 length:819 start_codon:yes stop_codon:yes gene_type:complete
MQRESKRMVSYSKNVEQLFNYSLEELKSKVLHEPFQYIVADNIFTEDVFKQLYDFKLSEHRIIKCKDGVKKQKGRVAWLNDSSIGTNYMIGGGGEGFNSFKPFIKTDQQADIFKQLNNSIPFWCDLFGITPKDDYQIGYKYSLYSNNYGWNVHPDSPRKVVSLLFFLDNTGWEDSSKYNGTQLYCVGDEYKGVADIELDNHKNISKRSNVRPEHIDQLKFYRNVHYKPNRMLAFLNGYTSYHGISPMRLSANTFRPCFQVNIWRRNKTRYQE